ncbi:corticoliberin [Perognathus longimembris pacificus]|uniref:corticoliberin n=1 Tax=Perognathus longimembris pacificus TaxID=214514 RepID=UPI002019C55F|nr:corticoliberin [Perognathus longimembris pacificus]
MRLRLLLSAGVLLAALLRGPPCGALLRRRPRRRRAEEPPISLDLTFHLLRQVLEMARAEQLAQRAHSNRRLMELAGK